MINLSDFNKNVKYDLQEGKKENRFSGDFEFYTLNKERFLKIQEGIQSLNSNANDLEVAYTLLPYICSINVDETLERFCEMNEYSPCVEFTEFMLSLTDYLSTLLKQIDKISEVREKSEQIVKDYPMLQKVETTEEKILRLTKEMEQEKDTKKKKTILLELAKLYEEVD